jgi:hypothetical protein
LVAAPPAPQSSMRLSVIAAPRKPNSTYRCLVQSLAAVACCAHLHCGDRLRSGGACEILIAPLTGRRP